MFYNLHEVYPEYKDFWVLTNKITDDPIELVVTMRDLEERFSPEELTKIINGSHKFWDVFKKY